MNNTDGTSGGLSNRDHRPHPLAVRPKYPRRVIIAGQSTKNGRAKIGELLGIQIAAFVPNGKFAKSHYERYRRGSPTLSAFPLDERDRLKGSGWTHTGTHRELVSLTTRSGPEACREPASIPCFCRTSELSLGRDGNSDEPACRGVQEREPSRWSSHVRSECCPKTQPHVWQ
jgi:hypothetical protein